MITLDQAKNLKRGDILFHMTNKNKDKTPQKWKVTSIKLWKKKPDRIEVHLKYGLNTYEILTENNFQYVRLQEG